MLTTDELVANKNQSTLTLPPPKNTQASNSNIPLKFPFFKIWFKISVGVRTIHLGGQGKGRKLPKQKNSKFSKKINIFKILFQDLGQNFCEPVGVMSIHLTGQGKGRKLPKQAI